MKKRLSVFIIMIAFILSIGALLNIEPKKSALVFAEENVEQNLDIKSKSCYLVEPYSKTVIYKKNENEKLPIASMCKIMTLLLTFENIESDFIKYDEDVIVSENASKMGGSQVFLEENGKYKVKNLVESIVIASANDSCVCLAERIAGTESNFVSKMNEKAKELGMNDTNFTNCTGLPKDGQYSTAKDVSTMFSELIKHKDYFNFSKIWMDKFMHEDGYTEISNTNKLIKFYKGCDGGKTGYTKEARHCLASTAHKDDLRLVSVIISAPDSKTRFGESSMLFNYGFNNFESKCIVKQGEIVAKNIAVKKGKENFVEGVAKNSLNVLTKKGEKRNFEIVLEKDSVKAPVYKDEVLGKINVFENGKLICSTDIVANNDVKKESYFDSVKKIIKNRNLY